MLTNILNGCRAAAGTLCRGLDVSAIHALEIVGIAALIAKEDIENVFYEPLQPPLACILLLIVVRLERDRLGLLVAANDASELHLSKLCTGAILDELACVVMALGGKNLGVFITASVAMIGNRAIGQAIGLLAVLSVRVTKRLNLVGCVPFAANGARVLVIALLRAGGGYPNGFAVGVVSADVRAVEDKFAIPRCGQSFIVADPSVGDVALLFGNLRGCDSCAVRENVGCDHRFAVLGIKDDLISLLFLFENGMRVDVDGRGCRNHIGNAVAIEVPTVNHKDVAFFCLRKRDLRQANDLRSSEDLAGNEVTVSIVEGCIDPTVSVNHAIACIPSREVFIPTNVLFVGFNIDGDAGNTVKCIVTHLNAVGENDVFEGDGKPFPTSKIFINIFGRLGNNKSFQICKSLKRI